MPAIDEKGSRSKPSDFFEEVAPSERAHPRRHRRDPAHDIWRLVHQKHVHGGNLASMSAHGITQPPHWRGHRGRNAAPGFALHKHEGTATPRNNEIHFETLFVAKMIELPPSSAIDLRLDDFRGVWPMTYLLVRKGCESPAMQAP